MKNYFSLLLLITFSSIFAQNFKISNEWKAIKGDDPDYKNINFDDSKWQKVTVPATAELQFSDAEFTGFAWYRITINLPKNYQKKDLLLDLGAIDDSDETYFNGELIGKTGKFPPNDESAWDLQRKYKIPKNLVKAKNVIAIKFYDGIGNGGLYKGNLQILTYENFLKQKAEKEKNKHSYHQLTTSNGLISAVYNSETDEIEAVYPHIFKMIDSTKEVKPFITNLKTNRKDKPISVKYLENTHIIEVKYKDLTIDYFASFTRDDKVFYAVAEGDKAIVEKLEFSTNQRADSEISKEKKSIICYYFFDNEPTEKFLNDISSSEINNLLDKELAFMRNLINKAKIPKNVTPEERNVLEQSVSILKMSQVSDKEEFPKSRGQILASLRPGVWAISWVRDATFAIEAMSKLGMYDEAKKGLEFMLNADGNRFKNYIFRDGKNYGPEIDYQISLTRYFGNGTEECDFNENGPNIEYDDWGLFLTALNTYVTESNDWEFFRKYQNLIQTKVADPIVFIIQKNGLLKTASGPWEHHLPGNQDAFTNGVNAIGLQLFAQLLKHENLPSEKYETGSKTISDGIMNHLLVDNQYIKGTFEEKNPTEHYYFDGATIELFANGFITDKNLFLTHFKTYDQHIKVKEIYGKNRGYIRFDSSDSYENQEWPFAGLRFATASVKFGFPEKAKPHIDRITQFAIANYNQIPEILTNDGSEYSGAIPMVGYGSAAYVLALLNFYHFK